METKFVKAYCKKTGQYYSLEVAKKGEYYKAVNMTYLSDEKAKLVTSEVTQKKFYTADTLLPCIKCQNRLVGGCNCSKTKHRCNKGMDYQFDCIYCEEFTIDNSVATGALGTSSRKITLEQGQEVEITFSNVEWLYFDNVPNHEDGSKFNEPKVHVSYAQRDIEFVGYNISRMDEGVLYPFSINDSFSIDCDIDTTRIKPHPGGYLLIRLGKISAIINQTSGEFYLDDRCIGNVGPKFNMKFSVENKDEYKVLIDNKSLALDQFYVTGAIKRRTIIIPSIYSKKNVKNINYVSFSFVHKSHNCILLSYASVKNIKMKLRKGQ